MPVHQGLDSAEARESTTRRARPRSRSFPASIWPPLFDAGNERTCRSGHHSERESTGAARGADGRERCDDQLTEITAVRLQSGSDHAHIVGVQWRQRGTINRGQSTHAEMIAFVRNHPDLAVVGAGDDRLYVAVSDAGTMHLQTRRDDGVWTDALLRLPRY